ncbi:MAG: phenylalanine--tRNA ligase beta subunit-related protein, partial [Alphaproteobacteria bacterium]|nr:phenylalanine--tRNA ligase beta subunit-related protein [Alphaproteobacteria bacterium]
MAEVALSIEDVLDRFPDYRVALVVARDLTIPELPPKPIETYVSATESAVADEWTDRPVSEIAEVAAWRRAYKQFGIRKTSYRPSVERLIRHIQRHGRLPRVNALVDLYNAVSVAFRMPAGADDLEKLVPPLAFRFSRPEDSFIALGDAEHKDDPPKPGEVVYADQRHVLCRRWNWYQDDRTATSAVTRRAVITVQSIAGAGGHAVEDAAATLYGLLQG